MHECLGSRHRYLMSISIGTLGDGVLETKSVKVAVKASLCSDRCLEGASRRKKTGEKAAS